MRMTPKARAYLRYFHGKHMPYYLYIIRSLQKGEVLFRTGRSSFIRIPKLEEIPEFIVDSVFDQRSRGGLFVLRITAGGTIDPICVKTPVLWSRDRESVVIEVFDRYISLELLEKYLPLFAVYDEKHRDKDLETAFASDLLDYYKRAFNSDDTTGD